MEVMQADNISGVEDSYSERTDFSTDDVMRDIAKIEESLAKSKARYPYPYCTHIIGDVLRAAEIPSMECFVAGRFIESVIKAYANSASGSYKESVYSAGRDLHYLVCGEGL